MKIKDNFLNLIKQQKNELKSFDLKNLDVNQIGEWPSLIQYVFIILVAIGIQYGSNFLSEKKVKLLNSEITKETKLIQSIKDNAFIIPTNDEYKKQLIQLKEQLEQVKTKLPEKIEMSTILDEINNIALKNNVTLTIIQLKNEKENENYIELPFQIESVGKFHNFIGFLSELAKMNRIVTVHNIAFAIEKDNSLKMELVAKTYKYKSDDFINKSISKGAFKK